jgi:transposase
MMELYAGVDIHKDKYVGCIIDKDGKIVREHTFPSTKEGAQSFLCGMPVKAVAIESCTMWRAAMKIFREIGYEVKVSSAKKTHDIACTKKTDKVDAKILADLLRTKYLPEVYVPNDRVLHYRDLARGRANLTRSRVLYQNKIKCRLLMEGIAYPAKLWNKKNMEWLCGIDDYLLTHLIKIRASIVVQEKALQQRIEKIARSHRNASLLQTMPGIAEFGALMIFAEIADINRFKSPKQLAMYAGLCPGVYQTGNTERTTRNHAVNKWLKWIVTECSGRATTLTGTRLQAHYAKIAKRKNSKVGRRSAARKMIHIIWHMLKDQQPYRAS